LTDVERPLRVAVVGAAVATGDEYDVARRLGAAIARGGGAVVCGGRGGVMEAAARGAAEGGGLAIGILPGADAGEANPWIALPLPTGMGEARNALVVRGGEAVLAVGGSWGTLSEIALARKMGLEVATLGQPPAAGLDLPAFEDPDQAAAWALETALRRRTG